MVYEDIKEKALRKLYMSVGWISSRDRWPNNGDRVLVVVGVWSRFPRDRMIAIANYYESVFTLECFDRKPVGGEVFWMSLPELPYIGRHEMVYD